MQRRPRRHDDKHLAFIRQLPCCVCGDNTATEAAHVKMPDTSIGKIHPGSAKPHDYFTVPLCGKCHRKQHKGSEVGFWQLHEIDPVKIALCLAINSGDAEECERVIRAARGNGVSILMAG